MAVAGRDGRLASLDRLEHRSELRRLEVLEQVALGAGLDRLEQVVLVLGHGQDHDRGRRVRAALIRDVAASPEPPGIRTSMSTRSGSTSAASATASALAAGEADDLVAPRPDERGDPVAEERVIVGDEDPHRPGPPATEPSGRPDAGRRHERRERDLQLHGRARTGCARPGDLARRWSAARRRIVVIP